MMEEIQGREVWVSIDGEFTGPIPGVYSMISLGAVAYTPEGEERSRFKINIRELPGSIREGSTIEWWKGHRQAWEAATAGPVEPKEAMRLFAGWLALLGDKPKLIGWPLEVDFMFLYWYFVRFTGERPPFGYDGIDIKSYAMAVTSAAALSEVSRTKVRELLGIPNKEFSHDPVDDAADQARLFFGLRKLSASR